MSAKRMSVRVMSKLAVVSMIGAMCVGVTGCGDGGGQPPVVIQQPAPVAPVAPLPPVVQVPPVVPPLIPLAPVAPTPVTTITIQIPGQLAPPPTYIPVQPAPYPPVVIAQPPYQPPYDPNCPPWWARHRHSPVTIIKIKPDGITIIQRNRGSRWDPWHRGPWFDPNNPGAIAAAAPAAAPTAPTTTVVTATPLAPTPGVTTLAGVTPQ